MTHAIQMPHGGEIVCQARVSITDILLPSSVYKFCDTIFDGLHVLLLSAGIRAALGTSNL